MFYFRLRSRALEKASFRRCFIECFFLRNTGHASFYSQKLRINFVFYSQISDLDYKQFASGSLSSDDLVHKYMAYLSAL